MAFTIAVETVADLTGFNELDDASESLTDSIKNTAKEFPGLTAVAGIAGTALIAIGGAVAGAIAAFNLVDGAITATREALVGLAEQFEPMIKNTQRLKVALDRLSDTELADVMDGIERRVFKAGISTDELNDASTRLGAQLEDQTRILDTLDLTFKVSTATGKEFEGSIDIVKDALLGAGEATKFLTEDQRKQLAAIQKLKDPTEKEARALDLLTEAFDGYSVTAHKSISAIKAIEISFDDLNQETAALILDIPAVSSGLNGLAGAMRALIPISGELTRGIVGVATGISDLGANTLDDAKAFEKILEIFSSVGVGIINFVAIVKVNMLLLDQSWTNTWLAIETVINVAAISMVGSFAGMTHAINLLVGTLALIPDAARPAWVDSAIKGMDEFDKAAKRNLGSLLAIQSGINRGFVDPKKEIDKITNDTSIAIKKYEQAVSSANEKFKKLFEEEEKIRKGRGKGGRENDIGGEVGPGPEDTSTIQAFRSEIFSLVGAWDAVNAKVLEFGSTFNDVFRGAEGKIPAMIQKATDASNKAIESMHDVSGMLQSAVAGAGDALGQAFADAITGADSFGASLGKGLLQVLADLIGAFAKFFIATGMGMIALQSMNPAAAIVAGVVLQALSSFIGGALAGGSGSGSGSAAVSAGRAPVDAAVRREADDRGDQGRVTVIAVSGLFSDDDMARKAGDIMKLAVRTGQLEGITARRGSGRLVA